MSTLDAKSGTGSPTASPSIMGASNVDRKDTTSSTYYNSQTDIVNRNQQTAALLLTIETASQWRHLDLGALPRPRARLAGRL